MKNLLDGPKYLNGINYPIDMLFDDKQPLKVRIHLLIIHWANLGVVPNNNDVRAVLFKDQGESTTKPLHKALQVLVHEGKIQRIDGHIHLVAQGLVEIPVDDPRVARLSAIENKYRGHKEKTGGWSYRALRRKLVARYETGLKSIPWRIGEDKLRWLWEAGTFVDPRFWHHLPTKAVHHDVFCEQFKGACQTQGWSMHPDEAIVLIAVDTLWEKHQEGHSIQNPAGYLRVLVRDLLEQTTTHGFSNQTGERYNIPWLQGLIEDTEGVPRAGTVLSVWAAQEPHRKPQDAADGLPNNVIALRATKGT